MTSKYIKGDIHNEILNIKDNTIDLIYTSPPYATTHNKWDKPLKWDMLFTEMWRVLKPNGIIILHCSMPFTYELLKYETPKYHYIWKKNNSTNFLQCKLQPLRITEEIMVYYKKQGTYNPQMIGDKKYYKRKTKVSKDYYGERNNIKYGDKSYHNENDFHIGKYPTTFLEYPIRRKSYITRNDDLVNFIIKTYSNENDLILDMTCCNYIVGNLVNKLNRNYIGIDIDGFDKK